MTSTVMRGQSREQILLKIESLTAQMLQDLADVDKALSLPIVRRRGGIQHSSDTTPLDGGPQIDLRFPGRNEAETWRITVILRLLDLIHESLTDNVIVSKRHIYYCDPALFKSQHTVDRYIEDIAVTFQAERANLNVTAAAKGLMHGSFTIHHRDGAHQVLTSDEEATLIVDIRQINSVDVSRVKWVLVVEKEASFRACVAALARFDDNAGGLVVTAKGYPDLITKEFVEMLRTSSSKNGYEAKPVYVLVDFDPDGYGIFVSYLGAPSIANSTQTQQILLGLTFDQSRLCTTSVDLPSLGLTARDRTRAKNMLKKEATPDDIRCNLQCMLCLNMKLELQHLDELDEGLLTVLRESIAEWQAA